MIREGQDEAKEKKMKKIGIISTLFCLLAGSSVAAAVLDWDATDGGWNDGDLSRNYSNVDSSGVDINVAITGDTGKFINSSPKSDTDSLTHQVNYDNTSQSVVTTIVFSSPVTLRGVQLRDIDSGTFNDKVILSAEDGAGNSVTPSNIVPGAKVTIVTAGSAYESDGSGTVSETDADGYLTFDLVGVTRFSFTYTSGSTADPDPGQQFLWLDNLTFDRDEDGDGMGDSDDIDDDNDGIMDRDEMLTVSETNASSATIPDNGEGSGNCLDRTFAVTPEGRVQLLWIDVDIDHSYRADLDITLYAPDGTGVDLSSDNGGSKNNIKAYFEDNATETITSYNQNMNSMIAIQPEGTLSDFNGLDANGTWTLHMCDDAGADEGTFNTATLHIIEQIDTDGDGITDDLDLDSDNDGIPDNVEAQSTSGYTAPSGSDIDRDGLDDAYDTDDGGTYVTLPDTDGDGTKDFRDSDADGDDLIDCIEGVRDASASGTKMCPIGAASVGANGLADWAETSDDYSDPNGVVNAPLSDLRTTGGSPSEADYRLFADNDGDGVSDFNDIDDDNDGILDSVEIQGGGNCAYGFFHVINGVLELFDEHNRVYVPIGGQKVAYNAMGYDQSSGKLFAATRAAGTDDYGTALAQNDIIEIDRYSGKIRKTATSTLNSYAADFYSGALYGRTSTTEVSKWNAVSDSVTTQALDATTKWADFSILPDSSNATKAYGLTTTGTASGATTLYRNNLDSGAVATVSLTVATPDGAELRTGWGATFFTKDSDGSRHLYAANNAGYIYEISNYDSGTPSATFVYRSVATNSNDGASCREANQYPVDTDGDGIPDYQDLDSDNDGIADNVEAQTTTGYDAPDATWTDADHDGLADQYDANTSGVIGSNGLIPPNNDGDNTADFLDNDSDNDGYTDCEEGLPDTTSGKSCPVNGSSTMHDNGVVEWADSTGGDYTDPNLKVDVPGNDLYNETGDTSEVGYREFLCGKANYGLEAYKWRLISVSCNTGSLTIDQLFGPTLGTYGSDNNWVMYKQTGDDNYEVNAGHKNTNKTMLSATDTLSVGVSYWIITDADHNITIDKTLGGLSSSSIEDAATYGITDPDFDAVHRFDLPNSSADNPKKYMAGNPLPYRFHLSNLYFSHNGGSYNAMGEGANDTYINKIVYKHNSADLTDKNVTNGGGYEAIDPSTPGFDGSVIPMEGFFIKIEQSDTKGNAFVFPLTMGNDE
jgi:subtilisin-like proprotein convertase family protein